MEFADDAKLEIEKSLKDTMRGVSLDGKGCSEVERELRSNYYEAAEATARSRGADAVTADDVRAAMADMGSPAETARCIMRSHADTMRRAGFLPRLAAFAIDEIVRGAIMYVMLLPMAVIGTPFVHDWNFIYYDVFVLNFKGVTGGSPAEMAALVALAIVTLVLEIAVFFGYYFVPEGRYGFTIGKYVAGLRVLETDGTRIGYREAFIRNVVKYMEPLLLIDGLFMLTLLRKERQRGSDNVAGTIVVHARG